METRFRFAKRYSDDSTNWSSKWCHQRGWSRDV